MLDFKPTISSAIIALGIEGGWKTKEGKIVKWWADEAQPPQSDIDSKLLELNQAWESEEYARKRQAEFPPIADLVVALYDTDDRTAIDAKRAEVKAKYPKP